MKKEGLAVLAVILLILVNSSFAQDTAIDKAYDCLSNKVENKCKDLPVEDQAFTVLSIGKCKSELQDKSKDDECWPSSGCRLRDTALAILALDRVGRATEDAEEWLLNQKETPTNLLWYLEIDAEGETNCKISYSGTERTITIGEDKKINKGAGSCLSLAQDSYWLKIKDTCYNVNFTISCDKDFKTTLLYSKKGSSTIYVSSKTNSASADGETEEKVNAFCFGTGCDYEGSLWATLALAKTDHDISEFLPYLIAMEEDNEKFFPATFLYIITDYDEYFEKIISNQDDYWKIKDSPYSHYYDTALALLALYGLDAEPLSTAKAYLLEVQGDDGCWNSVRDTAFILYAAFPKSISSGVDIDECEDYDYYCVSSLECDDEDVKKEFYCYGGDVCCKTKPKEQTCGEKGGIECGEGYRCLGRPSVASDTTDCCIGDCEKLPEESRCEREGYDCREECYSDEEENLIYDCDSGEVCCIPKPKKETSYWWIWLLIILIILLVIAIIFRNRLRMLIFKLRGRKGPPGTARPRGFPPAPPGVPRPRPRMIIPRRPVPTRRPSPIRRAISKTDKELEETLKKLKEMSK